MTERERLIELIKNSDVLQCCCHYNDFDRYCKQIADYLLKNGVIVPPCKVGDMVDIFFSHNTVIALWYDDPKDKHYYDMLWRGMAWNIPESYKSLPFVKFIGIVAETIDKSDTLNIKIELSKEEAKKALKERDGNG